MASTNFESELEPNREPQLESKTKPNFKAKSDERLIDYLRSAITDGSHGLADVPRLVRRVIEEDLWRARFVAQSRALTSFKTFAEFVCAAPPEGLGTSLKVLQRLCADHPAVLDLIERSRNHRGRGGDRRSQNFKANNVKFENHSSGNSNAYALRRLRASRPDLHRQVLRGELSVNRAMIAAGFRRQVIIISKDIELAARQIRATFSPAEIRLLVKLFVEGESVADDHRIAE